MAFSKTLSSVKWTYKVLRTLLFSAIIVLVVLFTAVYTALALPPVQNYIRAMVESELSSLFGNDCRIGSLSIRPLNEVILENAEIYDLDGEECLRVGRLGAGINLWRLLFRGEVEITYVELLDFKANINQRLKDGPLNIDFIIKALSSKDDNNPPARFDLKIQNIVIRGGRVNFDRLWVSPKPTGIFDPNHVRITGFSADIAIPRLSNDISEFDLRRLSFSEASGLQIKQIGGFFTLTPSRLQVKDFIVRLPESVLKTSDFELPFSLFDNQSASYDAVSLSFVESRIAPSNLSAFLPALDAIQTSFPFEASIEGNMNYISVKDFRLGSSDWINVEANARLADFTHPEKMIIEVEGLKLLLSSSGIESVLSSLPGNSGHLADILERMGHTELSLSGSFSAPERRVDVYAAFDAAPGRFKIEGNGIMGNHTFDGQLFLDIPSFTVSDILPSSGVEYVENSVFDLRGVADFKNLAASAGTVDFSVESIAVLSREIDNIKGTVSKNGQDLALSLGVDDDHLDGHMEASAFIEGSQSRWNLEARINDWDTYHSFLAGDTGSGYEFSGHVIANAVGNSVDNITGELILSDVNVRKVDGKVLSFRHLTLTADEEDGFKTIDLTSPFLKFSLSGPYTLSGIPAMVSRTLSEVMPAFFNPVDYSADCGEGQFDLYILDATPLIDFFNLPVAPLTELTVSGGFDCQRHHLSLTTDIPFILQGENKLITDTYLDIRLTGAEGEAYVMAGTVYPTKKGLLKIDSSIQGTNGNFAVDLAFNRGRNVSFNGNIDMLLGIKKDEWSGKPWITIHWLPSELHLNDALWQIEEADMTYTDGYLESDGFCIRHENEYVMISGHSEREGDGTIVVDLSDINMDYVFDTLNINHVTFGGIISGRVSARDIFSNNPLVMTENLFARDFSYNGAYLGDGDLRAALDLPAKKVAIGAVIHENNHTVAEVDGGVWFGRDSLSFDFKADKVNVEFIQPFMSAFSSSVRGRASGEAHLFGTFSDIDMTGSLYADSVDILIDYINTRYTGSDSIFLHPGKVEIPDFRVSDRYGHTAVLNGVLSHRYFHDPVFKFTLTDMDRLMVYDTNARINPLWYGNIFASGNGEITGYPGMVRIAADVETEPGSDFTFVLSDRQEAVKSQFLTFSDRRKEELEATAPRDTVPDYIGRYRQTNVDSGEESNDVFVMDFRVSVTDDVRFNLIMDPVAGDKIVAYGTGAMTLTYSSLTDDLRIYGKYVLDKGTYNFSLQDIILKEFTIKPGSSIAFTGNPYTGVLDMTAAYRVNTSLTELDRSFANDRELNRTSVPVEALLKVTGVLTSPSIGFDIELPTVTEETARKVRSIISTDDMMSQQVLYLVALNKFYPPEYMTTSGSGGEWASIASSTISSQIQNMIGQITDKFTLSPSIRSDKGDFSDIEVDLALSSQLFNNRLLINGNLGYRDPSNSSTTFVGDFDLEYLLNRKGTWRIKAYNHFNDQNYYLKSALTTQGLGIVWRKDFGIPNKKREEAEVVEEEVEIKVKPE